LANVEVTAGHGVGGSESPGFLLAALKAAADLPLAAVKVATRHGDGFSGTPAQNRTFLLAELRLSPTHPLAIIKVTAGHGVGSPESPGFLLAALKAAAVLPLAYVEVTTRRGDGFSDEPAQNPTFLLAELRLSPTHHWLL
jgi:hypothetical protein